MNTVFLAFVWEWYRYKQLVGVYSTKAKAYRAAKTARDKILLDEELLWRGDSRRWIIGWAGWKVEEHNIDNGK